MDKLRALYESFSLSNYEARLLAALVRLGWGTANQLAQVTGIYRPNVYPALEALTTKNLATRRPDSRGTWMCPAAEDIVARLRSEEAKRLADAQQSLSQRTVEARALTESLASSGQAGSPPLSIMEEARLGFLYEEAMPSVREEILVFNRGPFAGDLEVDPGVLSALDRGVKARAIYQGFELDDPGADELRSTAEAYVSAGVEARVAPSLPVALAVLDRTLALLNVPGGDGGDVAYVTNVVVQSPGLAGLLADAFDHVWDRSQPFTGPVNSRRGSRSKASPPMRSSETDKVLEGAANLERTQS